MSAHEYDNIYYDQAKESSQDGKLRFASQGVGWKSRSGELFTITAEDIKKATWLRSARSYQLRLGLAGTDSITIFDNFARDVYDEVKELFRSLYHITITLQEFSVKGWNWGKTEIQPTCMAFKVSNRTMFEIPYSRITNACSGKNEVTIEMNVQSSSLGNNERKPKTTREDQLVECRFHVPGVVDDEEDDLNNDNSQDKTVIKKNNNTNNNSDEEEEEEEKITAAEHLCKVLKSRSEFDAERGSNIGFFKELPFLTPRGRYDVELFREFMRLRGKSYDYKIAYTSITKLFVLPKPYDVQVHFVIGLDPPLRQGQTRYPFLVLQFTREEEITADLNLDDSEIAAQFAGRLSKSYQAPTCSVVPEIFRGLTGRKIQRSGIYRNSLAQNESVVKCSVKANEGFLHILDKSFLFIPKPASYIEHSDIGYITFSRVSGGNSKTFDLVFTLRGSNSITFSNISREEYAALEIYFKTENIKLKNELLVEAQESGADDYDDAEAKLLEKNSADEFEDEDDEDFVAGSSHSESSNDDDDDSDELSDEEEEVNKKKRKSSKEDSSNHFSKKSKIE